MNKYLKFSVLFCNKVNIDRCNPSTHMLFGVH